MCNMNLLKNLQLYTYVHNTYLLMIILNKKVVCISQCSILKEYANNYSF